MLIRLAWDWLGRWHEPLVVGAAVTLGGLAYWAPPLPPGGAAAGGLHPTAASPRQEGELAAATARAAPSLPEGAQYYRDLWARDAQAFYSLHRPTQPQAHEATQVRPVAAVASAHAARPAAVSQAYHRDVAPAVLSHAAPRLADQSGHLASNTPRLRRLRVATCLAAGMLASLVFAALWPAVGSRPVLAPGKRQSAADPVLQSPLAESGSAAGEVIALAIPSAWIQVRPTAGQMLRRVVLAGSYLSAALGGWMLFA